MMQELDGLTFLEIFRRIPDAREAPVIVFTAKDLTAEERIMLNGSVQKVMQKGISTDSLLKEVRDLLNSCLGKPEIEPAASSGVKSAEAVPQPIS